MPKRTATRRVRTHTQDSLRDEDIQSSSVQSDDSRDTLSALMGRRLSLETVLQSEWPSILRLFQVWFANLKEAAPLAVCGVDRQREALHWVGFIAIGIHFY